jgi:RNA polymerase sigma factor (sigma-70 family)
MADSIEQLKEIANTTSLECLLDRLRAGDPTARDLLIQRTAGRIQRHIHFMLGGSFDRVVRAGRTDDVFQEVSIRLQRALADLCPENVNQLMGLVAELVRRELIDQCRNIDCDRLRQALQPANSSDSCPDNDAVESISGIGTLEQWTILHELVPHLDDRVREVFKQRYYNGLSFPEIGCVVEIGEEAARKRFDLALVQLRRFLRQRGVIVGDQK